MLTKNIKKDELLSAEAIVNHIEAQHLGNDVCVEDYQKLQISKVLGPTIPPGFEPQEDVVVSETSQLFPPSFEPTLEKQVDDNESVEEELTKGGDREEGLGDDIEDSVRDEARKAWELWKSINLFSENKIDVIWRWLRIEKPKKRRSCLLKEKIEVKS